MDIREYRVKSLPYHFVLFYNLPESEMTKYRAILSGHQEVNSLLTYCYLDTQCGLSYKAVCCARLDGDEYIAFDVPEKITSAMTIREGGIVCDAAIFDEGGIMARFQREADEVKECYGYHEDMVRLDEDDPFSAFRHPSYPNDIQAFFMAPSKKYENMWVRETNREEDGSITGILLNEPYNSDMGVHKGDTVNVIPVDKGDGNIAPVAVLPWLCRFMGGDL